MKNSFQVPFECKRSFGSTQLKHFKNAFLSLLLQSSIQTKYAFVHYTKSKALVVSIDFQKVYYLKE